MIVDLQNDCIEVSKGTKSIVISDRHVIYVRDVVMQFDYYYNSVVPEIKGDRTVVDFSIPKYHFIRGYDFPIKLPSFSEPLASTNIYLDFAKLKPGDVVLDLGAYSGLTSILFKKLVGEEGTVIGVEADKDNLKCLEENLRNFQDSSGLKVEFIYGAIWKHGDGIEFSSELNMGSSAVEIVGNKRGNIDKIPSFTLNDVAEICNLNRVDFIKCDVEGAESVIFEDSNFFNKYKPKIIVEAHNIKGVSTVDKCKDDLHKFGYSITEMEQPGVPFPLLGCVYEF